ncbi:hypothetical protein MNEG_5083, partial [Monoraphidium neglectum]
AAAWVAACRAVSVTGSSPASTIGPLVSAELQGRTTSDEAGKTGLASCSDASSSPRLVAGSTSGGGTADRFSSSGEDVTSGGAWAAVMESLATPAPRPRSQQRARTEATSLLPQPLIQGHM